MSRTDYVRVERALQYLADHFKQQPTLAEIADSVHLSEFHFQRLFTQWVGISPKRFLQYLTLDYAKKCLAQSQTVLEASYASGLSTSSRLHDLFVRYECVSPGEYRRGGADLLIRYDTVNTLFGRCFLMATERGVCGMAFIDTNEQVTFAEMVSRWPDAKFIHDRGFMAPHAGKIAAIGVENQSPDEIKVALYGTTFQLKVWEALMRIPSGQRVTYQQVAQAVGSPKASRAVGSAVGKNPISWLIPCHCVIRSNGMLGGYHWGEARKLALLGWEAASVDELGANKAVAN